MAQTEGVAESTGVEIEHGTPNALGIIILARVDSESESAAVDRLEVFTKIVGARGGVVKTAEVDADDASGVVRTPVPGGSDGEHEVPADGRAKIAGGLPGPDDDEVHVTAGRMSRVGPAFIHAALKGSPNLGQDGEGERSAEGSA